MLTQIDRIQIAVPERGPVAAAFETLLDAQVAREDRVGLFAARRTVLRAGTSEIELLEPDGSGEIARVLAARGGGLFAAGFATPDLPALAARLRERGIAFLEEGEQLVAAPEALGIPGLACVVSGEAKREPVGLLRFLYEVTHLTPDWKSAADILAASFDLEASHFVPIESSEYGYRGTLTLFREGRLDRIETVTPDAADKTMGRFFASHGACFYMGFAESDHTDAIRERLLEHGPDQWTGSRQAAVPDALFIHPKALGGVMLGVSRRSFAWTWSGHPEWVKPVEAS